MSRRSTAIVARAVKQPAALEEILLDDPRQDEAIVEIQAVGICHADLAVLDGDIPLPFPRVVGHEGAGIVKEVGADIKHVKPGDKVILATNGCQNCSNCKQRLPGYCDDMLPRNWGGLRPDGSHTLKDVNETPIYGNFFGQSSFSRLAVVSGSSLIKMPPATDLKLFAPLGCGIQTGSGVVLNTLNVLPEESLIVAGCGAVGMSAIMAAKTRGAGVIIAVDIKKERLELARQLGATHALNGKDQDLLKKIRAICPLPKGVKYAFDTTAIPKIIELLIEATGVRGKTVVVGATPPDQSVKIAPLNFLNMGKQFVGSVIGESFPPETVPYLAEQYNMGQLPLEKIIRYYKASEFARAFDDMRSGETIKPVLVWEDSRRVKIPPV